MWAASLQDRSFAGIPSPDPGGSPRRRTEPRSSIFLFAYGSDLKTEAESFRHIRTRVYHFQSDGCLEHCHHTFRKKWRARQQPWP